MNIQQQMLCGDEIAGAVVDIGSAFSKFGFAGDDVPRFVFRSDIGVISSEHNTSYVYGDTGLRLLREDLHIRGMHDASVSKWEDMERIMQRGIEYGMHQNLSETPLFIVGNTLNSGNDGTKKLLEMSFESLSCPSMYTAPASMLGGFCVGRTTCLVIDIGASGTKITAIVDGYEMRKATIFTRRGGNAIDRLLLQEMQSAVGKPLRPWYDISVDTDNTRRSGYGVQQSSNNNSNLKNPFTGTSSFRDMHIRDLARDLKRCMCFVPYTPIVLPPDLVPKSVIDSMVKSALPPEVTDAEAKVVAVVDRGQSLHTLCNNISSTVSTMISHYREQELIRRSLQFPAPYELPDGTQVKSGDRLCTVAERLFFYSIDESNVVKNAKDYAVQQIPIPSAAIPPPTGKSKKAIAAAQAAQVAAVAKVKEAVVNQTQSVADAVTLAWTVSLYGSKKRAREMITASDNGANNVSSSPDGIDYSITFDGGSNNKKSKSAIAQKQHIHQLQKLHRPSYKPLHNINNLCSSGIINPDHDSLSDLVYAVVAHCDVDVRKDLLSNIQIIGGGALMSGIAERLTYELTEIVPSHMKVKVIPSLPVEKQYASWIGGSILSICGSFQQLWLTKQEYNEIGIDRAIAHFDH